MLKKTNTLLVCILRQSNGNDICKLKVNANENSTSKAETLKYYRLKHYQFAVRDFYDKKKKDVFIH